MILSTLPYSEVSDSTLSEKVGRHSVWMLLPETNTLFSVAKSRVFLAKESKERKSIKKKEDDDENEEEKQEKDCKIQYKMVLEQNPKWNSLAQILSEIEIDNKKCVVQGNTLVMVKDTRTCLELQRYLQVGGKTMVKEKWEDSVEKEQYSEFEGRKKSNPTNEMIEAAEKKGNSWKQKSKKRKNKTISTATIASLFRSQLYNDQQRDYGQSGKEKEHVVIDLEEEKEKERENEPKKKSKKSEVSLLEGRMEILESPFIVVHAFDREKQRNLLEEFQPRYVIIYDADLSFVRELEVWKAQNKSRSLFVYFLTYQESVEEHSYKSHMLKERNAFDSLIQTRAVKTKITFLHIQKKTNVSRE